MLDFQFKHPPEGLCFLTAKFTVWKKGTLVSLKINMVNKEEVTRF